MKDLLKTQYDDQYSLEKGPAVWIAVSHGEEEIFKALGNKFKLHPLTVEDCFGQSERGREKLEIFPSYLFMSFEVPLEGTQARAEMEALGEILPENLQTISVRLIVFQNCVISFHPRGVPAVTTVRKRLEKVYGNRIPNTAWLVHSMLDSIIDGMVPVVDGLVNELAALDDLVSQLEATEHRDVLKRIAVTRKTLLILRQRLWPKRDILTTLINKGGTEFLSGIQLPYLRDIYDHVVTMLEKIERTSDLLNALQSNYLAIISIDMNEVSNELNIVMKKLTAVATIILPLSLISGIFGMNVRVPFQSDDAWNPEQWHELGPFWAMLALMAGIMIMMIRYFRNMGFL